MDSLFFGPETRKAILSFDLENPRPYWQISSEQLAALLKAMGRELAAGPITK